MVYLPYRSESVLAAARSRSGENDYQSFSYTLTPLRYALSSCATGRYKIVGALCILPLFFPFVKSIDDFPLDFFRGFEFWAIIFARHLETALKM